MKAVKRSTVRGFGSQRARISDVRRLLQVGPVCTHRGDVVRHAEIIIGFQLF